VPTRYKPGERAYNGCVTCPGCGGDMAARTFEETYGRSLVIDICDRCQGLWLDGTELLQLSPGATLALFRTIADAKPVQSRISGVTRCPRCGATLADGNDLQDTTRFFFKRCPAGHGRFMTFFQFLRAKRFVRALSPAEVRRLKDSVRQVNCSNCGAPLDVDRSPACSHCGTPVSMIDPAQLEATLTQLSDAEAKRKAPPDPALPLTLAIERLRTERTFAAMDPRAAGSTMGEESPVDLVLLGLSALKKLLGP
jgi:Zn-finger nucleic acid-binding protein